MTLQALSFCRNFAKLCGAPGFYRPQGNIFAPVCHSVHIGGSASVHPPRGGTLPGGDPPGDPPQCRAYWEIRSTRGWYASYWNAILLRECAR